MATIKFANGVTVKFSGTPTPQDVEEVAKKLNIQQGAPAAPTPIPDAGAEHASFPATGNDGIPEAIGKTLGNIPSSALNFVKGTFDFLNPLNAVKTAEQIPQAFHEAVAANGGDVAKTLWSAYKAAIPQVGKGGDVGQVAKTILPQFVQHLLTGNLQEAGATIENDPVGQIAPLILLARGAADAGGKGAQFDQAISTLAKAVTVPAEAAARGFGNASAEVLGAGTGTGGSTIKETFGAAKTGSDALSAVTKAMRGEIQPEDIVQSAQNVVQALKNSRGSEYKAQLAKIGEDKASHDISPVGDALKTQLSNFNITVNADGTLDFSRSSIANNGSARADVQGVFETLKTWGSQKGDRTGVGLDTLKRQLDDFYSPSSQARAFVQGVRSSVSDILQKEVPGYSDLTSNYQKASSLLDDIKSATGAGSTQKADTIFTKLTTAMRGDKQFRLEVLQEMEKVDPTLKDKISGANLNSWVPRGLVGRGTDVGAVVSILMNGLNPHLIPLMLSTSPRIVGEFIRASGMGAAKASRIVGAVNKLAPLIPKAAIAATPHANGATGQ